MRRSARPIPLDKSQVDRLMGDLTSQMESLLKGSRPGRGVGTYDVLAHTETEITTVTGLTRRYEVFVQTKHKGTRRDHHEFGFSDPRQLSPVLGGVHELYPGVMSSLIETHKIRIFVDSRVYPEELLDIWVWSRFLRKVRSALVHEMTHAREHSLPNNEEEYKSLSHGYSFEDYVNQPVEHRAFLQMVVDEIKQGSRGKVTPRYRKRFRVDTAQKQLQVLLKSSPTWVRIESSLAPKVRRRFLKSIYQEVEPWLQFGPSAERVASRWLMSERIARKKFRQKKKPSSLKNQPVHKLCGIPEKRWGELDMKQKMAQVKRGYKRLQKAVKKGDESAKAAQSKLQKWVNTQVTKHFGRQVARKFWDHVQGKKDPDAPTTTDKAKGALKSLFKAVKGVSKSIKESLEKAPEAAQKLFTDSKYRKEQTKKMASDIRKGAPALAKKVLKATKDQFKGEWKGQKDAIKNIIRALPPNSEALTDKEKFGIYGAGVYWAGLALSAGTSAAAAAGVQAAAEAGGVALMHSLCTHTAIRTTGTLAMGEKGLAADEAFLHTESIETIHGAGAAAGVIDGLDFSTSAIPGFANLWEFIKATGKAVTASEGSDPYRALLAADEDKALTDFMERWFKAFADNLENLSDEDLEAILKHPWEKK